MNRRQMLLLVSVGALAACGRMRESRMNPRNWFGGSREEERPDLGPTLEDNDNRALVATVTEMAVEPTSSGAIVRAEGMTTAAGWWDVDLVAENAGRPVDGVLTLRFVGAPPRTPVAAGGDAARRVVAAYAVPMTTLEVLTAIVVVAETNSRRSRR